MRPGSTPPPNAPPPPYTHHEPQPRSYTTLKVAGLALIVFASTFFLTPPEAFLLGLFVAAVLFLPDFRLVFAARVPPQEPPPVVVLPIVVTGQPGAYVAGAGLAPHGSARGFPAGLQWLSQPSGAARAPRAGLGTSGGSASGLARGGYQGSGARVAPERSLAPPPDDSRRGSALAPGAATTASSFRSGNGAALRATHEAAAAGAPAPLQSLGSRTPVVLRGGAARVALGGAGREGDGPPS